MGNPYTLTLEDNSDPADVQAVEAGLRSYNLNFAPETRYKPLNIFLRDQDGRIHGGLLGNTYWGWLYVSIFWLDESLRGKGFGRKVLSMAEQEALRRGCHHAHLDTLDFQAPGFYEKLGYTLWGMLDNLPSGHKRCFYQKELTASHA